MTIASWRGIVVTTPDSGALFHNTMKWPMKVTVTITSYFYKLVTNTVTLKIHRKQAKKYLQITCINVRSPTTVLCIWSAVKLPNSGSLSWKPHVINKIVTTKQNISQLHNLISMVEDPQCAWENGHTRALTYASCAWLQRLENSTLQNELRK